MVGTRNGAFTILTHIRFCNSFYHILLFKYKFFLTTMDFRFCKSCQVCYYIVSTYFRGLGVVQELIYAKSMQHELLSEYEEQALLYQAQSGDENARDRLIMLNLRLVYSIAQKYANSKLLVSAEDLMGDGVIGLTRAISGFDLSFGTRLSTYATLVIHHAIARSSFLHGTIRLPDHVRDAVRAINRAKATLQKEGQPFSVEAISELSEIEPERVDKLVYLQDDVMYVMSLDEKVSTEEDALSVIDTVADERLEKAYHEVEIDVDLDYFLSKLYAKERFIVERSYGIPIEMNNREIAKAVGMHYNDITGERRRIMGMLKALGRALRGSVSEQKEAIENPQLVMRGCIPLFDPSDMPQHLHTPQQKKNKKSVKRDTSAQLSLFDLGSSEV